MAVEKEVKMAMEQSLEHLRKDFKGLRSARANPALVEGILVEVYGTNMKIKELASITTPEARQILIVPFDAANSSAIGKAIENANLNVQPKVERNQIRINIPPMDEATRKEIAKQAKKKAEETKVVVREIRRKFNDLVKKQKSDGLITEDDLKREEKKIQELTDKYCKDVDTIFTEKEKEIMAI